MHRRQSLDQRQGIEANSVAGHEWVAHDIHRVDSAFEIREGGREILGSSDFKYRHIQAEWSSRRLQLADLQNDSGPTVMANSRQPLQAGDHLAQKLKPLGRKLGRLNRQACDIAAWPRQGCNQASTDRVRRHPEHDRDNRCRLLCRDNRLSRVGDDNLDFALDELGRDLGKPLVASIRPAIFNRDGATFDPAALAQASHESSDPITQGRSRTGAEEADGRELCWLLRARRERPRRSAAEQRDEGAALHSITSSARASSVGGTSRPSAFATIRLITKSNLVGCSTGMSAGFAPRSILSTKSPARRHRSRKFGP